jgi:hypothetical protein
VPRLLVRLADAVRPSVVLSWHTVTKIGETITRWSFACPD